MPNKTDLRGEREGGREEGREGEREGIKMKIKNSFHPKFFAMRFEGDENRLFKSNNFVSPPPHYSSSSHHCTNCGRLSRLTYRKFLLALHRWSNDPSVSNISMMILYRGRLSPLWEWKSFNRIILFFSFLSFMKSCGYLFVCFFFI